MKRRLVLAGMLATTVLPPSRALAQTAGASPSEAYAAAIEDLVAANHILAHLGVVDGFGHVSVRDPRDPANYLLARSMAPALVTASDVLTYDLHDDALDANGRASYLERFIHGAIYRARPDVVSVVHSHAPDVIPFGDSTVALRPVYHMGSFLGAGVPVFEIRDAAGPASDMLVSSRALGDALARTLGTANVALMRGHGMVAVGARIPEAVFRAYYTMLDARLEAQAIGLGGRVTYLNAAEARASTERNQGILMRAWELWKRDFGGIDAR
jgi:ribulose-5-phosphate 4-epimerase/fuculose-1-phosphate aldolase